MENSGAEEAGLVEKLVELWQGPYGNYIVAAIVGVVLFLLLLLWMIRRFRQGRQRWEEARGSARGMHLGMQGNVTSGGGD